MSLWVIKIGTSLLRGSKDISTQDVISNYCSFIASCLRNGNKIILVSSGAVGLGCNRLGIKDRPDEIISLQAAAAVGQGYLMSLYEKFMGIHSYKVAQILLTRSELGCRTSYQNASLTLKRLLEWNVVPIVNENDIISNEELKYGDNDTLSALVATAVSADQLILLTDIDHLYSSDPRTDIKAKPITDIHHPDELKTLELSESKSSWGTGGITTKLIAAKIATESGITVHLADGNNPKALTGITKGEKVGTVFHPHPKPIGNKKSWLAHAIKPLGAIELDKGAIEAITNKGASLLLVGIKGTKGNFSANQPVQVIDNNGKELARGICSLSSESIKIELAKPKTSRRSEVVIHRDALVLTSKLVE